MARGRNHTDTGLWWEPGVADGSARSADEQLGGPPASWKGGDMGRAGRLSVESSGDADGRDRIEGNCRLRCTPR